MNKIIIFIAYIPVTNGEAYFDITLPGGDYNVSVSYLGDSKFNPNSTSKTFTVTDPVRANTTLTVNNLTTGYLSGEQLVATLQDEECNAISDVEITAVVGNIHEKLFTDENGEVRLNIKGLTLGNYTATFMFTGNKNYIGSSATANVMIVKEATIITVNYDASTDEIVVTLTSAHGLSLSLTPVYLNINGIGHTLRTDYKGMAKLSAADFTPGVYNATASYKWNNRFYESEQSKKIYIDVKMDTTITLVHDADTKELVATLSNADGLGLSGTNVNINVDGVDYAVKTNSKGVAKLSIADLTPGNYVAAATYNGNSKFNSADATINFKVKIDTCITLVHDESSKELIATLTTAEGGPLSSTTVNININGADYAVKTNSCGVAKLSLADLAPGSYTASISYNGNSRFGSGNTTLDIEV